MHIAFISYEYPPDTALGGIATYVYQAARMLQQRGHAVEVFVGSPDRGGTEAVDGVLVHRVWEDRDRFAACVGPVFAARHAQCAFDVVEGTDYRSDASEVVRLVPDVPFVLRLHTPKYLATAINRLALDPPADREATVAALQAGTRPPWRCDPQDPERLHALLADEIVVPSEAIGRQVAWDWDLDTGRISHVPNVFVPSKELLELPLETQSNTVLFLGRLEARKGVIELIRAMPAIASAFPQVRVRFVGRPMRSPRPEQDMREFLEAQLGPYRSYVEFVDQVEPAQVPAVLGQAAVCVFPSYWENFSMACLEAMAAGRAVAASRAGGLAEMLAEGTNGRLLRPFDVNQTAETVIELLRSPELRMQLGLAARQHILQEYNADRIAMLQIASYRRAIARSRERSSTEL